jgi:hypothetical protein
LPRAATAAAATSKKKTWLHLSSEFLNLQPAYLPPSFQRHIRPLAFASSGFIYGIDRFPNARFPLANTVESIDHEHRNCNGPFTGSSRQTLVWRSALSSRACAPCHIITIVAENDRRTTTTSLCVGNPECARSTVREWQPPRRWCNKRAQIFSTKRSKEFRWSTKNHREEGAWLPRPRDCPSSA